MKDMRSYKESIKAAVKKESEADKNWNWTVKAVNKGEARIGWGYLDFLGEKDMFIVTADEDEDMKWVEGKMPNGAKAYALIGDTRWDDAKTFEEGVAIVIRKMASSAHRTY